MIEPAGVRKKEPAEETKTVPAAVRVMEPAAEARMEPSCEHEGAYIWGQDSALSHVYDGDCS